ncbi:DNA polymerase family B, exonuclease domain [Halopenitus malekzadehii]|uniref:DNA polymerase family B, exonuclease domain n=2 Tax=Halopenitus malekzadehii TaxID=1267564 RepID=A0A1H6J0V7_9EURY|nr:DNA polymerase family B, exonuclease domain [Halopenitus malekzadehii]
MISLSVLYTMENSIFHQTLGPDEIATRYASIDIECNSLDPTSGRTVAIGIGLKDTVAGEQSIDVLTLGGALGDEGTMIRRAFERINEFDPNALVTYNGEAFDLDYLSKRIESLQFRQQPELYCAKNHVDLFVPRKRLADEAGVKWPSLEEVLDTHGLTVQPTMWEGEELSNSIFGERLASKYIAAVSEDRKEEIDELENVIHQYVVGDIESNIALYEIDAGRR